MKGKRIDELHVGDCAEQTDEILLENAIKYAAITRDNNPIHFDTDEAHCSRYGKPIAHGMILAGFISGVIGSALPGFGCIYESQDMTFLCPVYYGDVITTRVTVKECIPERNRVVLSTECFNQKQERVLKGKAIVLPRKD